MPCTTRRVDLLQPGDEVEVYDGRIEAYVWRTVLDVVQINDREKLRIEGCNFYFDAGCVRDYRLNHYVSPHHRPAPAAVDWDDPEYSFLWNQNYHTDGRARRTIY
jgi:hypothetical protein